MRTNYWRIIAFALVGLAFIGAGLSLALLSDPKRFSLSVADDRNIQLFALSGFACTLVGIGLFLAAVRHTTQSMPAQLRTNANIGVGIGFVLQLAGLFLPGATQVPVLIGLLLILASLPVFIWGTMNYAKGKGHSMWVGLVGVTGIIGLIVLILLPDQNKQAMPTVST